MGFVAPSSPQALSLGALLLVGGVLIGCSSEDSSSVGQAPDASGPQSDASVPDSNSAIPDSSLADSTPEDSSSPPDDCPADTHPKPGAIVDCAVRHLPQEPADRSPQSASAAQPLTLRLSTLANDAQEVLLLYWNGTAQEVPMQKVDSQNGRDRFEATIALSTQPLYYRFHLVDGSNSVYLNQRGVVGNPKAENDFFMTPRASGKTIHYQTDFQKPALYVLGPSGYSKTPLAPELSGWQATTGLGQDSQELSFYVKDEVTGQEDRPPGGGDYYLEANLPEAWLKWGTVYDVPPDSLAIDYIDAHTHPFVRNPDGQSWSFDPQPMLQQLPAQRIQFAISMTEGTLETQQQQMDALHRDHRWIIPLLWVNPNRDSASQVQTLLQSGRYKGLKFHPVVDQFSVASSALDPFMALAQTYRLPVQFHSSTDAGDTPDLFVQLAQRYPTVPIIMVHTELGALHKDDVLSAIQPVPNLYAETSWCNPESILQIMQALDSSRTLFGTDATVDSYEHFSKKSIANPQGQYVYSIPEVMAAVKAQASEGAFINWAQLTAIRLYRLRFRPEADLLDTDGDGLANPADPDDDNDGRPDESDSAPLNPEM